MATANERRVAVRDQYRRFIGRNHYKQALRNYCVKKYRDGRYYSDCSSSVSYAYREAGEGFGILNTVGMWTSKKLVDVPVVIKKGVIQNPEVLRIGDMLLFAGNDARRKAYGYVGHVEMVGEISGSKYILYGHGSGLAKKHEMNAYCRSRYNTRAATPLGRRLLIRVRRRIRDDAAVPTPTPGQLAQGQGGMEAAEDNTVLITGRTVYLRSGPGRRYAALGVVHLGERMPFAGGVSGDGWLRVCCRGKLGWVSGKYARLWEA